MRHATPGVSAALRQPPEAAALLQMDQSTLHSGERILAPPLSSSSRAGPSTTPGAGLQAQQEAEEAAARLLREEEQQAAEAAQRAQQRGSKNKDRKARAKQRKQVGCEAVGDRQHARAW